MIQNTQIQNIINALNLDLSETKVTGDRGWSAKQEKELVHNINRFAAAAKKQYKNGDHKNAYLNMRVYVEAKNKLYNHPIDEFDLEDALYDIHQYFRRIARKEQPIIENAVN